MLPEGKHMSTVSVIIPAYNQGHYLGEAVQSVLNQIYGNLGIPVPNFSAGDRVRTMFQLQMHLPNGMYDRG